MTRIFEALKKSQARAGALPFPPAEAPSRRPAAPGRPTPPPVTPAGPPAATSVSAGVSAPGVGIPAPRIETRPAPALTEDVVREMTALRIGLESALATQKTRIVMFLGSMTGEGVTTVATQFASVLGFDGRGRVLLLDAQTGAPRAEARPAAPGLPVTRGGPPLSVARLSDEVRRAGGRAPTAVRAFLAAVATQFDWVVVDGAPVLDSPESVDLAPLVDGVVLVVRSGHTKRPVIVRAVELLRKSGARVLGTVLNRRRLEIPDFIYRRV